MSDRRRDLPASTAEIPRVLADQDLLSVEARARLEHWSPKDRARFTQLVRDAATELQRELLQRALAANHDANELHAFADALRALSDEEAFEACTPDPDRLGAGGGGAKAMAQLLAAQADPLVAFQLNSGELSPALADDPGPAYAPKGRRPLPAPEPPRPPARPPSFEEDDEPSVSVSRSGKLDPHFLGDSEEVSVSRAGPKPRGEASKAPAGLGPGSWAEDLLCEAVKPFGLTYREQVVDGPRLSLPRALEAAALALKKGIPVPVLLGPSAGEHRRYALLLQLQLSGKTRAFQLHDPFAKETVWVNEGDFIARAELPLSNKQLRRLTGIALPRFAARPGTRK